eukprot:795701-Pyramimonas_sp.AAC.1
MREGRERAERERVRGRGEGEGLSLAERRLTEIVSERAREGERQGHGEEGERDRKKPGMKPSLVDRDRPDSETPGPGPPVRASRIRENINDQRTL